MEIAAVVDASGVSTAVACSLLRRSTPLAVVK
jgi:hypothetical protein